MANPQRGEIEVNIAGKPYTLCLTLGALAELEHAFASESLIQVIERFQTGNVRAGDLIKILKAGLKGGGHDISEEDVAHMKFEGGLEATIAIVAQLLNATFAVGNEQDT